MFFFLWFEKEIHVLLCCIKLMFYHHVVFDIYTHTCVHNTQTQNISCTHTHTQTNSQLIATLWGYPFALSIVHVSMEITSTRLIFTPTRLTEQLWATLVCYCSSMSARKLLLMHMHTHTQIHTRAVLFWLFPKTVNLPPKPVGFRLTFIQ